MRFTKMTPRHRTHGENIRDSLTSKIPLEVTGIPIYDELPDKPTHDMECDPAFDIRRDKFDKAQDMLDELGEAVDKARLSRDITANSTAQAKPESAEHTEQSEVND